MPQAPLHDHFQGRVRIELPVRGLQAFLPSHRSVHEVHGGRAETESSAGARYGVGQNQKAGDSFTNLGAEEAGSGSRIAICRTKLWRCVALAISSSSPQVGD